MSAISWARFDGFTSYAFVVKLVWRVLGEEVSACVWPWVDRRGEAGCRRGTRRGRELAVARSRQGTLEHSNAPRIGQSALYVQREVDK